MKPVLLILGLALALASPVRAQRADQLPRTNSLAPGDLLTLTTSPDSTNRASRGMVASNAAPALADMAGTDEPFILYGLGDSTLSAQQFAANAMRVASTDPRLVGLVHPVNVAISGSRIHQWTSNHYETYITPIKPRGSGQPSAGFLMMGLNDLGDGVSLETFTNRYATVVAKLRADGVRHVWGSTIFGTNAAYLGDLSIKTNVNTWLRSQTNAGGIFDALVDADALAYQLGGPTYSGVLLDGIHPSATFYRWLGTNLANVALAAAPKRSPGGSFQRGILVGANPVSGLAVEAEGAIQATGMIGIWANGRMSEGFTADTAGVSRLRMKSYNLDILSGEQDGSLRLYGGAVVQTNGPGWYSVSNNTAANGSILTTTDGRFYVRTNGAWLMK